MRKRILCLLFVILKIYFITGYRIFSMEESGSCSSDSAIINIGSAQNSSGILINSFDHTYVPGQNCTVLLRPPFSYGIVISIRKIDLQSAVQDYDNCENYLEISPVVQFGSMRICGYSNDEYEFQSFINWGNIRVSFHTSNSTDQPRAEFKLTFTAVRKGSTYCFKDEKRCHNHHCIWKGLTCDGHNNCGDLSDELDKFVSMCAAMSPAESLYVILLTIVGSLIFIFIAAYFRGPKITRQIERLSERRADPEASTVNRSALGIRRTVPTISRIRTNYGSTNQLLPSYNSSDMMFRDPPPRYEEIQASASIPVNVTPVLVPTTQISVTVPQESGSVPQTSISVPRDSTIMPQNHANRSVSHIDTIGPNTDSDLCRS